MFCTHISTEALISQHGTLLHVYIVFYICATQWAFCLLSPVVLWPDTLLMLICILKYKRVHPRTPKACSHRQQVWKQEGVLTHCPCIGTEQRQANWTLLPTLFGLEVHLDLHFVFFFPGDGTTGYCIYKRCQKWKVHQNAKGKFLKLFFFLNMKYWIKKCGLLSL